MATIVIDKSNWSWKRIIKDSLLRVVNLAILKVYDKNSTGYVKVGRNTSLGQRLSIVMIGGDNIVEIGTNCHLNKKSSIFIQGDGNRIVLGDNIIFDQNVLLVAAEGTNIRIGDGCLFANGVQVRTTDQHPIFDENGVRINPSSDVEIGNCVWVGTGVMICKGVKIGEGAVIGAKSVVTKDVPPFSIAVGIPAKVIKQGVHWSRKYDDENEQLKRFGYL